MMTRSTASFLLLALVAGCGAGQAAAKSPAPASSPGTGRLLYDQAGVIKVLDLASGKTESYDLPERMELGSWSFDGRSLLYSSDFGVSRLDLDAQTFTALTPARQKAEDAAWSSDGKRIVYAVREPDPGLYVYEVEIRKAVRLPLGAQARQPSWAPDGRSILFTAPVEGVDQLFLVPASCAQDASCDTAARQLTHGGKGSRAGAFSPDGARIAFERDEGGGPGITLMNPDGTALRRLSPVKAADHDPAWGTNVLLAFEREPARPGAPNAILAMKDDGTGLTELVKGGRGKDGEPEPARHPAWWIARPEPH